MTPYQYAKTCYIEGRFPAMMPMPIADRFVVADGDWNVLETKTSYATRSEAFEVIDKARDRARRFI